LYHYTSAAAQRPLKIPTGFASLSRRDGAAAAGAGVGAGVVGGGTGEGTFIIHGADGRGGRATVLRPPSGATGGAGALDLLTKKARTGGVAAGAGAAGTAVATGGAAGGSQGLQMEHFFTRKAGGGGAAAP
jgi:hypothetical protein